MLVRFRFRFRFEDMNPALSSATNTTRSYTRPPYHTSPPSPSPSPLSKKRVILVKDFHVSPDESGMRLDRFLKHRFDRDRRVEVDAERLGAVSNVLINKWLRKRQIKLLNAQDQGQGQGQEQGGLVSGGQAMSKAVTVTSGTARTEAGQIWRVRALWEINGPDSVLASTTASDLVSSGDAAVDQREKLRRKSSVLLPLQDWVVYKDERMIVLDKPPGIAVQGGTGVEISIDESLSVLQEEYPEKPRIVHRLDSTTSGLLILARTRKAAQDLASRFHNGTVSGSASPATKKDVARGSDIQKKYVAIVRSKDSILGQASKGMQETEDGLRTMQADMAMVTQGKKQTIRMLEREPESMSGTTTNTIWPSKTDFRIANQSCRDGVYWALLHLYPQTGRKHQLRVHCAQLLNAPILGDIKYATEMDRRDSKQRPRIYLHMAELKLKVNTIIGNSYFSGSESIR
ncbi:pseudouridine synthase [Dissophora ornata]|nr:pseudouridine synthase [Dissophora ornata]